MSLKSVVVNVLDNCAAAIYNQPAAVQLCSAPGPLTLDGVQSAAQFSVLYTTDVTLLFKVSKNSLIITSFSITDNHRHLRAHGLNGLMISREFTI